jgi:hypothetical protein
MFPESFENPEELEGKVEKNGNRKDERKDESQTSAYKLLTDMQILIPHM